MATLAADDVAPPAGGDDDDALLPSPELPSDAVRRVLASLAGDVPTLCAAACVARCWRVAARDPKLWRSLDFSSAPQQRIARRLTDARLAALTARAGSALQRVNLAGCVSVSARGVVSALQGLQLHTLAVGGVQAAPEDDKDGDGGDGDGLHALLLSLVRRPAGLDVFYASEGHLVCNAVLDAATGRTCALLGVSELCRECELFYCSACDDNLRRSAASHGPPCEHICRECSGTNNGNALVVCQQCAADASSGSDDSDDGDGGHNSYCYNCILFCEECGASFCAHCSFELGMLNACEHTYDADHVAQDAHYFCESCSFELGKLRVCSGCSDVLCCEQCIERGKMVLCDSCGDGFCAGACAPAHLATVGAGGAARLLCTDCVPDGANAQERTTEDAEATKAAEQKIF
jgi:hypothetical protein